MGQQVSVTKLKEQIEAAKRGLADMSPVITAVDPAFQPVAMPAVKFAGVAGGHVDDAPDVIDQNMVANDDMAKDDMAKDDMAKDDMAKDDMAKDDIATSEGFQFFHRPKRSEQPLVPPPRMSMANVDINSYDDDQPLFQALDQRLDRLEDDIAQNRKHILELITLLSGLDMAAKPAGRNSASVKYLLRRYLYWFVIGFLVVGWVALTPSGHIWINYFLGLI
jgi:pentapeptide MXKDX repeat protein